MTETRTAGKIETVAHAIAEHLDGWRAVPSPHGNGWWDLQPVDDNEPARFARLTVRRQQNDLGRITVTGAGPAGWTKLWPVHDAGMAAKCTASIDRAPAAIARDIQRKVLPLYLPALASVVERLAKDRAAAENRTEMAAAIARDYQGGTIPHDPGVVHFNAEHVRRIELNHDGTLAEIVTFRLPIHLARKVLDLLTMPTMPTEPASCKGCHGEEEPLNTEGMCGSCVRLDAEVDSQPGTQALPPS